MKKTKGILLIIAFLTGLLGLVLSFKLQDSLFATPSIIAIFLAIIVFVLKPNKTQKSTAIFVLAFGIIGVATGFILGNKDKEIAQDTEFETVQNESIAEMIEEIETTDFIEEEEDALPKSNPKITIEEFKVKQEVAKPTEKPVEEAKEVIEKIESEGLLAPDIE